MRIVLDFDGVLHKTVTDFIADDIISDGPVEGMSEWCWEALNRGHELFVFSGRSKNDRARAAMSLWLMEWGFPPMACIDHKVYADVYLDDKAYEFDGTPPDIYKMEKFRPWIEW